MKGLMILTWNNGSRKIMEIKQRRDLSVTTWVPGIIRFCKVVYAVDKMGKATELLTGEKIRLVHK